MTTQKPPQPRKGWGEFLWNWILIPAAATVGVPVVVWGGLTFWGFLFPKPPANPSSRPPSCSSTIVEKPTEKPSKGDSTSLLGGTVGHAGDTRIESPNEKVLEWKKKL